MISKIKTIIFSRFKKPNTESFVEDRRKICAGCKFNSINSREISLKMKIMRFFSDTLTFVTKAEKVDLGQCIHPNCGCDLYFKTQESLEVCPENKWKTNK